MAQASIQFDAPGVNVFSLIGPNVSGSGIPQPIFKPGSVLRGDRELEVVLCTLVLGSTTTLTTGQAYVYDKDFTATLLSTSNSPFGSAIGFGLVQQSSVVAGTYYIWLARAGHVPVACTSGSAAAVKCETTATAGTVNFVSSATVSTKQVTSTSLYAASATFTANVTNLSTVLTGVPLSALSDIAVGAAISGTGIPASTTITAITQTGANLYSVTMNNAATATNAGVTITATQVLTANVYWPQVGVTN